MRLSAGVAALALVMTIIAAPGISSAVLISYTGNTDANNQATIDVTFNAMTSVLTLTLDNTSPALDPIITGVAFDVPSGVTNLTATSLPAGWGFVFAPGSVSTPQPVGTFDACLETANNPNTNCNGGNPGAGLGRDDGTFSFVFSVTGSGLTEDAFVQAMNDFGESAVRFQNTGPLGEGSDVAVPNRVPEPAALALIGSGLIGLAVVTRRIRK